MNSDKHKQIENLKKKTGITSFNPISSKDFKSIQNMLMNDKLSKEEIALLTELVPNYIEMQKDFVNGLKEMSKEISSSQKSAFDVIDKLINVLETLAKSAQTDETRLQIAEYLMKLSDKLSPIVKEMNSDNNEVWKKVLGILAGAAAIGTVIMRIMK